MTQCPDVVRRTADALRNAPVDPGAILEGVRVATDARALCVLRAGGSRVVADGVWEEGYGSRHQTTIVAGLTMAMVNRVDALAAVQSGAEALSIPPFGDWACARAAGSPMLLGVAGLAAPVTSALESLATAMDIVLARDAASVSARLDALLQERARIASVIHGGVSQELATISVQLEVLSQLLTDTPQVHELAGLTRATTRLAIASIREAILDLTPVRPESESVAAGIHECVEEFAARWAVDLAFELEGEPRLVDRDVVGLAYAFVQEALTNLRKYSAADGGAVSLVFDEYAMSVVVRNEEKPDGDPQNYATGQGLQLMKGRARLLGGDVRFSAGPDGGREVMLRVPV